MPLAELELQYEEKFGRELPLEVLGFDTVTELLNAMSDTVSVKERGNRKVVCMIKCPTTPLVYPPHPNAISFPSQPTPNKDTVATLTGRGFDLIRTITPLP